MDFDYKALGLKCGLECHQQLDTGKLFSRTPSLLREDTPDFKVKRRIRAVASELGEHDKAAIEAVEKGLYYIYEGYYDTIGLIEIDEEPIAPLDDDALRTTLEVALLSKSRVIDEMIVMRKAIADGSNCSGFQRTILVATGGSIDVGNKKLGIQTIVLEEDSARPTEKGDWHITYRLDRLGIPLIELATEPGIETPQEAKEAARAIGTIFRLTGKVKRGLGTIRQDLNVSIRGGARTEIKGVQDLEIIDEYVRREVQRQNTLLEIKSELAKRGAKKPASGTEGTEITDLFSGTEAKILKNAISKGESAIAVKLEKFAGLLGKELQPNRRLGTEFTDHVKAKAGLKGLFHSDELPNYGITEQEVLSVKSSLGCAAEDAFVMVAGQREKAGAAIKAILERAAHCFEGVPEETRGALEGGNNEYLRPLPGAARMYPETDIATMDMDDETLQEISAHLPLSIEERLKLYKEWGLNEKLAGEMKMSNYARFFGRMVDSGADPKKTAVFLLEAIVEARREGAAVENLGERELEEFIIAIKGGKLPKEIQTEVIAEKCRNPAVPLLHILKGLGAAGTDKKEAEKIIQEVVARNSAIVKEKGMGALAPLMGDAMKELKGKISGKEISDLLKKEITKALK
ncbi:MAG TPA: Glu-tRNA(Gln) amidotransferase subunit GatE [archaeon]|nr:Glu-tRNA(Gln) amidotransferase subunit GatE [archaeon]